MKKAILYSTLAALMTVGYAAEGEYDYEDAGADWATEKMGECHWEKQSPIDLPKTKSGTNFKRTYPAPDLSIELNWTGGLNKAPFEGKGGDPVKTYQVTGQPTGTMTFDSGVGIKGTWDLAQFHMHAPSEHRYQGEQRDVEFHFVHIRDDKENNESMAAVLSVSFEAVEGATDTFLSKFISGSNPASCKPYLLFLIRLQL